MAFMMCPMSLRHQTHRIRLERRVAAGELAAKIELGVALASGTLFATRDRFRAIAMLQEASKDPNFHDDVAHFHLGCLMMEHWMGLPVPEVGEIFSRATAGVAARAREREPRAVYFLAVLLQLSKRRGWEKDFVLALEAAAAVGDALAQFELGIVYSIEAVAGFPPDMLKARYWLTESAMQGCTLAAESLGESYKNTKEYASAAFWFLRARNRPGLELLPPAIVSQVLAEMEAKIVLDDEAFDKETRTAADARYAVVRKNIVNVDVMLDKPWFCLFGAVEFFLATGPVMVSVYYVREQNGSPYFFLVRGPLAGENEADAKGDKKGGGGGAMSELCDSYPALRSAMQAWDIPCRLLVSKENDIDEQTRIEAFRLIDMLMGLQGPLTFSP